MSKLFADAGVVTLVRCSRCGSLGPHLSLTLIALIISRSFISPYRADRDRVRQRLQPGQFVEIFMKVPLAVCETRDPKGLYKKARAGEQQ